MQPFLSKLEKTQTNTKQEGKMRAKDEGKKGWEFLLLLLLLIIKKQYPEKGQVLNIQWNRLEEVCMFYCMSFTCLQDCSATTKKKNKINEIYYRIKALVL